MQCIRESTHCNSSKIKNESVTIIKQSRKRSSPLPWNLASSRRGNMMVELRVEAERMAVVYMRGSDCTTTGIRCTWLGSLLGLEGGTGWMMCKNCWPLTPWEEPIKGPGVKTEDIPEETEVMTEGEDDDDDDGEKAEVTGEVLEEEMTSLSCWWTGLRALSGSGTARMRAGLLEVLPSLCWAGAAQSPYQDSRALWVTVKNKEINECGVNFVSYTHTHIHIHI